MRISRADEKDSGRYVILSSLLNDFSLSGFMRRGWSVAHPSSYQPRGTTPL